MNLKRTSLLLASICLVSFAFSSLADLKPGDAAPKKLPSQWAQGEPVKSFEPGKVYLVEFWATWCGPCREAIPHLNELHNKFKDKGLVIISVNDGETEQKVKLFLQQEGTNMSYRVGLDPDQELVKAWWGPSLEGFGIPHGYLIDKTGRILFAGHPMELTEETLQQTLDGTMTVEKMAASQKELDSRQARLSLATEFMRNFEKQDWAKAGAALDELEKSYGGDAKRLTAVRFQRLRLLLRQGNAKAASEFAAKQSETDYKDDPEFLDGMAWLLITESGVEQRDLPLAEKLCRRSDELTQHKNPQALDTLSRILFMAGKKDDAIKTQTDAIALADGAVKQELQKNLDSYKEGKLPALN